MSGKLWRFVQKRGPSNKEMTILELLTPPCSSVKWHNQIDPSQGVEGYYFCIEHEFQGDSQRGKRSKDILHITLPGMTEFSGINLLFLSFYRDAHEIFFDDIELES